MTEASKKKKEGVKCQLLRCAFSATIPCVVCNYKNSQSIYLATPGKGEGYTFIMKRGFCFSSSKIVLPPLILPSNQVLVLPSPIPGKKDFIWGLCGKTPTDGIEADDNQFLLSFRYAGEDSGFCAYAILTFSVVVKHDLSKVLTLVSCDTDPSAVEAFVYGMKALTVSKRPPPTPAEALPYKEARYDDDETTCVHSHRDDDDDDDDEGADDDGAADEGAADMADGANADGADDDEVDDAAADEVEPDNGYFPDYNEYMNDVGNEHPPAPAEEVVPDAADLRNNASLKEPSVFTFMRTDNLTGSNISRSEDDLESLY